MKKNVLTIAGLDPSAGAGLAADLKVFEHFDCNGFAMATALTVQSSRGVFAVNAVEPTIIAAQGQALFKDFNITGVKLGMLGNKEILLAVTELLQTFKPITIILDPILISSSGKRLLSLEGQEAMIKELLPLCSLITPNIPEAEALTGLEITDEESTKVAGQQLLSMGPDAVLIKGGHSSGPPIDWLFTKGKSYNFKAVKHKGPGPHGTGCHLSSAILCLLAHGEDLPSAVQNAKTWLLQLIASSQKLGQGTPYIQI
ncbi:MAG: bifunctional hydroxymethylpyrimidine kinase/phosphomethylpyrimidine kinase [SAR324 cluster bacterium]|nr:bifunctional hydroxymethylpyrimidine kinase/phosphomethylpyrimidine kinase [SAR324 cluster bacterium]